MAALCSAVPTDATVECVDTVGGCPVFLRRLGLSFESMCGAPAALLRVGGGSGPGARSSHTHPKGVWASRPQG